MSSHTPEPSRSSPAETLPFGLSFVDGRGVLTLVGRRGPGPLVVDLLEMEIPGLRFPFDLSGGVSTFRHRRCTLQQATLSLAPSELQRWLHERTGRAELGYRAPSLRLGEGFLELQCQVVFGDQTAELLLRGFLRPSTSAHEVELCLVETRLYGVCSVPAPLLAAGLLQTIGASLDPAAPARLIGCTDVMLDPLALTLRHTLPRSGWRLPAAAGTRLSWILVQPERIQISYGPSASRTELASSPRVQRFHALQEAKTELRDLEEVGLASGPRMMLEQYRQRLHSQAGPSPFVSERVLQLLAAEADAGAETLALCAALRASHPDHPAALLAEASVRLRQGEPLAAGAAYRGLADLAHREGNPAEEILAALSAGRAVLQADRQQARRDFERVLELDPDNEASLAHLVPLYAEVGEWGQLVELRHRQLARTTGEQRIHAHLALGELYRARLSEPSRAREHYEQALALDPTCEPALRGLAEACIDGDDLLSAVGALDQLGRMEEERLEVDAEVATHLRIASLWEHLGDTDRALARLERALSLRPGNPQALQRAAITLTALGEPRRAGDLLQRLLATLQDPGARIDAHRQLAEISLAEGALETARAQLEAALALDSEDAPSLHKLLAVVEQAGDPAGIANALGRIARIERDPAARSAILLRRGSLLAELGATEEAATAFEAACFQATDGGYEALRELARLRGPDDPAARGQAWRRVLGTERGADDPEAWAELARSELARGALVEGEAAARRALELGPSPGVRELAQGALVDASRARRSDAELRRSLEDWLPLLAESGPRRAALHAELGEVCCRLDDLEAAAESLERALELGADLSVRERYGRIQEQREAWDEARDALQAVLDAISESPDEASRRADVALRLGTIAERQTRPREAVELYRRALLEGLGASEADRAWDRIIELHLERGDPAAAARAAQAAAKETDDKDRAAERLFRAGQIWLKRANQRDLARDCFREAVALRMHIGSLDALESLFSDGDPAGLVEVLQLKAELCAKRPAIQKALFARLGETLHGLGRTEEARTAYTGALSLDADYLPALRYLATDARSSGEVERAEVYHRRILSSVLRPEAELGPIERTALQVETHLRLAEIARRRKQPREEEGQLELALSLDPRDPLALEQLDALLGAERRFPEQLDLLRRRIEVAPDLDQVIALELRRGALLESLPARREEAVAIYRQVLLLSPGQDAALRRLTPLLHEAGRTDELVEVLEQRAAQEEAGSPLAASQLWQQAARACRGQMPGRAVTCYRRALRLVPDQVETLTELLESLGENGDPDELEDLLGRLIPLCDPEARAGLESRLAELRAARGARAEARDLLRRAAAEGRASLAMLTRLASLEAELDDPRQSAETWGRVARLARESDDRDSEIQACRGLLALSESIGAARVEPACRRLLELDAGDRITLATLANVLQSREEWSELVEILEELRREERASYATPEEELATLSRLALSLDRCGRTAEAARVLGEAALPLARPLGEPMLWPLAGLARDLGFAEIELACLRALEENAPINAALQLRAAELATLLGDRAASLRSLRAAIQQLPPGAERASAARRLLSGLGEDDATLEGSERQLACDALELLLAEDATPEERLRLAILRELRGQYREALEAAATLGPEARELRWRVLERLGETESLIGELAEAAATATLPDEAARLHCRRASLLASLEGNADEVERAYLAALERVPDWAEASAALHTLYLQRRDGERLTALLQRDAERESDLTRRALLLLDGARRVQSSLHDPEHALTLVRRARELRPADPVLLALAADLNQELGRLEAAEQDLLALTDVSAGPGAVDLLERAACLARLRGDSAAEARHLARIARARRLDAALLTRLVAAHASTGDDRGLRSVLEEHASESPEALLELARIDAAHGDRSAALDAYRRYLALQPTHRESLEAALALSRERGDRNATLQYLRALRDLHPHGQRRLELSRELGELEEEQGHFAEAAAEWRTALLEAPADPEILIRLAECLTRIEAWHELGVLLEESLAGEGSPGPISGEPRARLALLLGEAYLDHLGDPRSGAEWLRHACELAPKNEGAFRRLMAHHMERQELVEASELLARRILQIDPPERPRLQRELGYLLEEIRDLGGAAKAYAAAFRENPELDPRCAERAHDLYLRVGGYRDALEILDQLIARTAEAARAPLLALKARTLVQQGQVAEAITGYERALERDPGLHGAHAELGRLLFERGRFEDALPHLQRAGAHHPELREAASCSSLAARTLEKLGLADEAMAWYERAIARDPTTRAPYEALLPLLEERGSWEKLEVAITTLVSLTVDPAVRSSLLSRLGAVQRRLGHAEAAEASWQAVLQHDPAQSEALTGLRQLAGEHGDWPRCSELLERELESSRDPHRRAQLHRELGQLAAGPLDDSESAISNLQVALELDPRDTLAAGLLLSLLEDAGQTAEVARLARRCAQHCDDSATRRQLLEQALTSFETLGATAEAEEVRRELARTTAPFPAVLIQPELEGLAERPAPARAPFPEPLEGDDGWAIAQTYRQRAANPALPADERAELLMAAARTFEDKLARTLEALALYEEAALLAPGYLPAIEALADAAYRNQDWHRARDLYDRLWQEDDQREQVEISYRRALVYETLGDEATADLCYARTVALSPTHRPALEGRARLALFRDDVKIAIDSLSSLERLVSVDEIEVRAGIRQQLGKLLLREGNLLAAREYLEGALSLDSKRVKALQTLLSVLQALGDYEAMLEVLQQLLCLTTDPLVRASLLHHRAEILGGQLDDEEAAVDNLLRAYDLAPDYPPTLWRLVDYYWEQGDLGSVAEMGDHLVAADAVDHDAPDLRHLRLAVARLLLHEDRSALALVRHVLAQPELQRPALEDLAQAVAGGAHTARLAELLRDCEQAEGGPPCQIRDRLRDLVESSPETQGARALLEALEAVSP